MKDACEAALFTPEVKDELDKFYQKIHTCTRCELSKSRTNFVFGCGNHQADIMFVGEAPGANEDKEGIPFVGRAGKLLDKIFQDVSLTRDDVFIANVLKCRPPQNRDPKPEEITLCEPYLHEQIRLIQPKVIVALGRIAANTLLNKKFALKDMRCKTFKYQDVDLRVVYHPAAILRNMNLYDTLKGDLQYVIDTYLE